MLVNLEGYGRLGNRLFLDAHLSAFCWKHGFTLRNAALDVYSAGFAGLGPAPSSPLGLWWQAKLPWSRHFRYWGRQNLDFDETEVPDLVEPLSRGKTVFFHGWLFRGFASVARFRDKILARYRPLPSTEAWADQAVADARARGDVVIGVHVRWEDYRGTVNFLSLDQYRLAMTGVAAALAPRRASFLIFSNEELPRDGFGPLEVAFPNGDPLQDLTAMARCDYLMAPTSTFSGWASFYGQVPLLTLNQTTTSVGPEAFAVLKG